MALVGRDAVTKLNFCDARSRVDENDQRHAYLGAVQARSGLANRSGGIGLADGHVVGHAVASYVDAVIHGSRDLLADHSLGTIPDADRIAVVVEVDVTGVG